MPSAETLVDHIATVVRTRLPPGVTVDYFDGFLARNRSALVTILDRQLSARGARAPVEAPPDLWSASQRTAANLAAMRVAAAKRPNEMTDEDRRTLATYSGWGGLSIEGASKQFPLGFPAVESGNSGGKRPGTLAGHGEVGSGGRRCQPRPVAMDADAAMDAMDGRPGRGGDSGSWGPPTAPTAAWTWV